MSGVGVMLADSVGEPPAGPSAEVGRRWRWRRRRQGSGRSAADGRNNVTVAHKQKEEGGGGGGEDKPRPLNPTVTHQLYFNIYHVTSDY